MRAGAADLPAALPADGMEALPAAVIGRPAPQAAVTRTTVCPLPAAAAATTTAVFLLPAAAAAMLIAACPLPAAAAVVTGLPALRAAATILRAAHPAAGSNTESSIRMAS